MRLLMLCLVCCVAGLAALPALAAEESSSLANGLGSSSSSFALGGSLVIPGSPNEGEQLRAQEEAKHASPEAEREREESEMAYSGLGSGKSEELAGRLFPRLVNAPDGGVPQLPEGERIVGFPSDFAASLVSADGKHGVIDSPAPIAVETPSGRVSVDVSPRRAGSGFEAVTPAARMHVRVGGRLSEGASLSDLGVTLTPVTESGTPLEGNGQVDGASVFYGNSEDARAGLVDVDTLVKLDTYGFREETILRSQRSPEKIFFKVGLPEGASLAQDGSGPVQVLAAGQVIATVLAPGAQDAAGTFVPVAARVVAGDTLMLTVPHPSGRYQYPIVTDPYAVDQQLITESGTESNWTEWSSPTPPPSGPFHFREFGAPGGYLEDRFEGSHGATGWWGRFEYVTQGTSRVGMFAAYVYGSVIPFQSESQYVSRMTIGSKQGVTEDERVVPGYFNEERETVCAKPCENVYGGTEGNHASYGQYFEKEGTDGFWALMDRPEVVVS
ncbi:MAG TPA: hypothetical protein VES65_11090, partial [Solirubrobacteraceae bacterium]|nr:hypothetical protein [Solirubrobacteraceae bacterium]